MPFKVVYLADQIVIDFLFVTAKIEVLQGHATLVVKRMVMV